MVWSKLKHFLGGRQGERDGIGAFSHEKNHKICEYCKDSSIIQSLLWFDLLKTSGCAFFIFLFTGLGNKARLFKVSLNVWVTYPVTYPYSSCFGIILDASFFFSMMHDWLVIICIHFQHYTMWQEKYFLR